MSEPLTLDVVRSDLQKLFDAGAGTACGAFPLAQWIQSIDAAIAERDEWRAMVVEWRTKAAVFEAERNDALVRINDAPVGQSLGVVVYYDDGKEHAAALLEGKRVRLVVEE